MWLERRCPGCGGRAARLCPSCRRTVVPGPLVAPVPGLDEVRAWCRYEGAGRAVVLAVKHRGRRDLVRWLAAELAPLAPPVDRITWVPASGAGRRRRGYDQGALLGRALGRALGVPASPLLRRPAGARSQRGRSRAERLGGVAFTARRRTGGRLLLVDDVVTTGSSLAHGAAALRRAGAASVTGLVVAVADRDLGPCPPSPAAPYGDRTGPERCEVAMEGHGHEVRCTVPAPDGSTAVAGAVEEAEAQLRREEGRELARTHGLVPGSSLDQGGR